MGLLKEISSGSHYFDIATTLRDSIFVNGFLWNLETWYNNKEQELKELEKIDKMLLKRMLNVPVSTPSALLYRIYNSSKKTYISKVHFDKKKR